ncbi:uncharacterized protein LOC142330072 isoform X2 [Lycorma delicatula]|uniref:uncharacterized protein LOC142330072 isoform X2 n=1 Tax=Lycorma delicatula TaxID=130591 RepID=UPI003F5188DF
MLRYIHIFLFITTILFLRCKCLLGKESKDHGICSALIPVTKQRNHTIIRQRTVTKFRYFHSSEECDPTIPSQFHCLLESFPELYLDVVTKNVTNFEMSDYCCPGFKQNYDGGNELKCILDCNPSCINGICNRSGQINQCVCENGMILQPDNVTCLNLCDPPCENGDCISFNVCSCHQGYKLSSTDSHFCSPICKPECINAVCIAPNICKCLDNHKRNRNSWNECAPVCNPSCINSDCLAPNFCVCHGNYTKSNIKQNECHPICDKCNNGECVAPNKCNCNEGYALHDNDCKPICKPECINSICIKPNRCECLEGFENSNNLDNPICKPSCYPECVDGDCTAPNICTCHNNFKNNELNNSLCEPICLPECENGNCIAPNICKCNEGFMRNDTTERCEPYCYPPCINSDCIKPNYCECHDNYHKINNNNNSHVCQNKIKPCKKKIKSGVSQLDNSTCYEFDEVLKTFDEECKTEFTNVTCYDEFCKNNQSKICEMFYTCDIWPDMSNSNHIVANCMWNNYILHTSTNSSDDNVKYGLGQHKPSDFKPEFIRDAYNWKSEYSFKQNFDDNPCLLCFCPVEEERITCQGEKIRFRICQCPSNETTKKSPFTSGQSYFNDKLIKIISITITVLSFNIILFAALKFYCKRRKQPTEYKGKKTYWPSIIFIRVKKSTKIIIC